MMKLRPLLFLFSLFLSAVLVRAQVAVVISNQAGQNRGDVRGGVIGSIIGPTSNFAGNTGLPFSADVVEENDKLLADGNRIHYEVHGKIFRDSEGRMRTETEAPVFNSNSKPFVHINITDLVEERIIFLDTEHKIATVTLLGQPTGQAALTTPKDSADQHPKVQPGHILPPPTPDPAPEDLGTSQIEGFTVQGTRSTHIMTAGMIGNDRPIATTTERWFSIEFKMDLVNITENPESGKHVRKLVNIHAGEPDPLLFQIPPDFKVKEMPQQ